MLRHFAADSERIAATHGFTWRLDRHSRSFKSLPTNKLTRFPFKGTVLDTDTLETPRRWPESPTTGESCARVSWPLGCRRGSFAQRVSRRVTEVTERDRRIELPKG